MPRGGGGGARVAMQATQQSAAPNISRPSDEFRGRGGLIGRIHHAAEARQGAKADATQSSEQLSEWKLEVLCPPDKQVKVGIMELMVSWWYGETLVARVSDFATAEPIRVIKIRVSDFATAEPHEFWLALTIKTRMTDDSILSRCSIPPSRPRAMLQRWESQASLRSEPNFILIHLLRFCRNTQDVAWLERYAVLSSDTLAFVHHMDDLRVIDYIPLKEIEEVGADSLRKRTEILTLTVRW